MNNLCVDIFSKGIIYRLFLLIFIGSSVAGHAQRSVPIDSLIQYYENDLIPIDSLVHVYENEALSTKDKISLLDMITFETKLPAERMISYCDSLISLAKQEKNVEAMVRGHINLGHAYENYGDYTKSITAILEAIRIGDSSGYSKRANSYNHLGYLFIRTQNFEQAEKYFKKAETLQNQIDSTNYLYLMSIYFNLSDAYLKNNKLDSAFINLEKSKQLAAKLERSDYNPYFEGNFGVYLMKSGQLEEAEGYMLAGAEKLENSEIVAAIEYYNHLTDFAQIQGDLEKANRYSEKAFQLGQSINANTELIDTYYNLYELSEAQNDPVLALEYFKTYEDYKSRAINISTIQNLANLRVANKQKEVDLIAIEAENQELRAKKSQIISIVSAAMVVLLTLLVFGLFNRFKYIRRTSRIIAREKERSDDLLKNILPDETANELKAHGRVSAKQFKSVTVMFVDFCGFTRYSQNMDPDALVQRVDFYFSRFDEIMEKYDLEKIKTLGDAYMCAGGLPFPSEDHAVRMVKAAFEMGDFVRVFKEEDPDDPTRFDCRIGITTGPVVAGVVGTKKFVYDIWGDTVNIASRMESNSEPGKINVSENTYQIIKDRFECEFRGMVDVKNKGMMRMYFVNRESPVVSRESGVVSRKGYG